MVPDSLEHVVFSRKDCKLLVHNFFQRKMKGHFKCVFFISCPVVKNSIFKNSLNGHVVHFHVAN